MIMGLLAGLFVLGAPAQAAFPPLRPAVLVPPPPGKIVSPTGTHGARIGTPNSVTVRWYVSALLQVNINAPPSHFVVCAQPTNTPCTWPMGSQPGVFTSPAAGGAVTSTPQYLSNPFGPRIIIGYNYSMTVSLTDPLFDRSLQFAVAACAAPTAAACVTTNGGQAWYTTKELAAQASIFFNQGQLLFTGQAANIGSSSATFTTRIRVGQAVVSRSNRCETDPEAVSSIFGPVFAVLRDGSFVHQEDAVGLDVVALTADPANFPSFERSQMGSLPGGGNIGNPIGMVSMDLPVSEFEWAGSPFAAFIVTRADSTLQVVEVNEADNTWVECRVFFP